MSKRQILMLLGVIVILFLFSGFPEDWKEIIAVVSGAMIIFVAYRLKPEPAGPKKYPFVEQKNGSISTPENIAPSIEKPSNISQPSITQPDITNTQVNTTS